MGRMRTSDSRAELEMTTRRRPSRRMLLRLALPAIAAVTTVLLLSGPAMAGQYVDAAAKGLATDPVYVSDTAERKLTQAQQTELRQRIEQDSLFRSTWPSCRRRRSARAAATPAP